MTFDRAYVIWYLLKPLLGAIMGVIAVLIVQAGFFALQGDLEIKHPTSLLVLAFIGGFSERFFIQTIDRVITSLLGGEKSASAKTTTTQFAGQSQTSNTGNDSK